MPDTKLIPARPRATRLAAAALTAVFALGAGACSSGKSQSAPTTTSTVAVAAGATTATDSYRGATIVVAGHGEATGRPNTMTMSIGASPIT